ncbi:MAG: GNAT family N-acetyltransferase [Planctomycetes bacterium]|nr:GNAT family N-acetyltransferase [Planctomycetota bacterium]
MLDLVGPVTLRPFVLTDARVVEPWLRAPGLSVPAGRASREWPQRLLADARIVAGIAEVAGRRVGFVRLDVGPDHIAEITMVVAPECRRRGHGRQMFAAALREARRRGVRQLVAVVDLGNEPALEFFAEVGFEADGRVGDRLRLCRVVHAGDHQPPLDVEA